MKIFEREEMIREEGVEQGITQGITQGIVQGQSEGSTLQLLRQITKKVAKGKSPEVIAEELEEDAASIALLYDLIKKNPDKSVEELLSCIGCSATPDTTLKSRSYKNFPEEVEIAHSSINSSKKCIGENLPS